MSFDFFKNAVNNGLLKQPNNYYRELNQAFVDDQWDNTVAVRTVQEQDIFNDNLDSFTFHNIEVWIDYVVGESSTGRKTSEDFASLIFRDLNYEMVKGRYYEFNDNFWISYYQNDFNGVSRVMAVRRCNNWLKIINPDNGAIYSIPCAVDYDMAASARQVGENIITPNNHAVVMVQGNAVTNKLFKTNKRFILGGRPFKITGYQNAINTSYVDNKDNLLYLDLFLDEIWANDNLEAGIADNGTFNYKVRIDNDDNVLSQLTPTASGNLYATVTLNGAEIDKPVYWYSDNINVIKVSQDGEFEVVGNVGDKAKILVGLSGNLNVFDAMMVEIIEEAEQKVFVVMTPSFDKIREYESITFDVRAIYNGAEYKDNLITTVSLNETEEILTSENLLIEKNENVYTLSCLKRSNDLQTLYITVSNSEPPFEKSEQFNINLVNLMG